MIRYILFDLDETLYPPQAGIMEQIRILMLRYLRTRLNLSPEEAEALRRHYFQTYGTTMRGLQINYNIDPNEFLDYVHDIPLHEYLQPNPDLDRILASVPQEKVVFTNASREHAERVLDLLGIRRHFVQIIDVRDMNYESKPLASAYHRICELLGVRPEECMIVEDNVRNLQPAKAVGMTTVLIRDGNDPIDDNVDYVLSRVEEIGVLLARMDGPDAAQGHQVGPGS
jgi:putative hydrolase of the HAD superfamily